MVTELDTFIQKFHQLWNSGHTAHLDLDTCAWKAWVGLRVHVQLGYAPGPPHEKVIQEVNEEAEPKPNENVNEVKTAETVDTEKALSEESRFGTPPKNVEETEDKINQKDEEEIIVFGVVEETAHARQDDVADKNETQEIALKEVVDEICSDVDYVAKAPNVVKSQYPIVKIVKDI